MLLESVVAVLLAVLLPAASAFAQPPEGGAALRLTLEAVPASGPAGNLELRMLLEHDGARCLPMFLDPYVSPFVLEGRGTTRLVLDVRRTTGEKVELEQSVPPDVVRLSPDRLLLLDCGSIWGRTLRFDRSFWQYPLTPGTYRITARLELDTLRGIKLTPAVTSQLASRAGVTPARVKLLFPKGTFVSNEVTVTVTAP